MILWFLWGTVPIHQSINHPVKSEVRKQSPLDACCSQDSKAFYKWHTKYELYQSSQERVGRKQKHDRIIASMGPGRWPEISRWRWSVSSREGYHYQQISAHWALTFFLGPCSFADARGFVAFPQIILILLLIAICLHFVNSQNLSTEGNGIENVYCDSPASLMDQIDITLSIQKHSFQQVSEMFLKVQK